MSVVIHVCDVQTRLKRNEREKTPEEPENNGSCQSVDPAVTVVIIMTKRPSYPLLSGFFPACRPFHTYPPRVHYSYVCSEVLYK